MLNYTRHIMFEYYIMFDYVQFTTVNYLYIFDIIIYLFISVENLV